MTITLSTLSNGLRVVTDTMAHLESLALGVWVETGGRHEPAHHAGISHLLEHMAFKGTTTRSARAIAEEIEAVGGYINAYTSRSQTAFYVRLLKDDLALGMDLLADILTNPTYAPAELERERGVILQEIGRALDSPEDLSADRLQALIYPEQPLGRAILGTADTVRAMTSDDLHAHRAAQYGPDRMIIAVAGAVEHAAVLALAEQGFGTWPRLPSYPAIEPAAFTSGMDRLEGDYEQLHVNIAWEGVSETDPDYYTALMHGDILGGGMSSRLFQSVREERGLAYAVYAYAAAYEDTGKLQIYAGTGATEGITLLEVVADEVRRMADGVTQAELSRARAQVRSGVLMARESPYARAETAVWDLGREGRVLTPEESIARIEAVSAADVAAYGARLLERGRPALCVVGPLAPLPDYDNLVARLRR